MRRWRVLASAEIAQRGFMSFIHQVKAPFFGLCGGIALGLLAGCASAARDTEGNAGTQVASTREANQAAPSTVETRASQKTEKRAAAITYREEVPQGVTGANGITVPRGFTVTEMASGLTQPRRLVIAPGATPRRYDVFFAESSANRVSVLRVENGSVTSKSVYTDKADQPYGLAFHPAGWLYVGNTDAVVRFPYKAGATKTDAAPQRIAKLTEGGYNQHWTRNLMFSRDAKKLYVTVGSSCNTCEEGDPQRAAVSVMNSDGSNRRLFASGLRNPVGLAWQPGTDNLWAVINERDNMGDNVPPDYLTQLRDGAFYGWPYAYTDINRRTFPDPTYGEKNTAKVKQTVAPTVPVQAHSAALGVAFYPQQIGDGVRPFPREYSGNAFLAFHGSWNRSAKTGYKIVRVTFRNGQPTEVSDFVRGFLKEGGDVWGRPVDVQVAPDGSLLFSDDGGGKIWKVSYTG
jgi:glucose/arabinose dehydrogenase